jgi:hypothetical protein
MEKIKIKINLYSYEDDQIMGLAVGETYSMQGFNDNAFKISVRIPERKRPHGLLIVQWV